MNTHNRSIGSFAGRLATVLLLLFALPSALAPVQAQDWLRARSDGGTDIDEGWGIAVDAEGNTYVTGYFFGTAGFGPFTLTSAGEADVFVVKYAPDGEVLWARSGGGIGTDVGQGGMSVDADGNAYVTGFFEGTAAFGPFSLISAGGPDIFVVKYSSEGDVLWARRGGGTDVDRGWSVAVDAEGNAYVTGIFAATADFGSFTLDSAGSRDFFLVKYAPGGDVLWARSGGGIGDDRGFSVAMDAQGNACVTGLFSGTATFGAFTLTSAGSSDVLVVKYAPDGDVLWARGGGGTSTDVGRGVAVDAQGNAYVTGAFFETVTFGTFALTSAGSRDVFVVKYAPSGEVLWAASGGGTGTDESFDISVDAAGNAYVTGFFAGTATFGANALTSTGDDDAFLVKYAPEGEVLLAESGGGTGQDWGIRVAVDAAGNAYVTGTFWETATFGPFTLTGAGFWDVFVAKYGAEAAVTVSAAPLNPPVVIPPAGGSFAFIVTLTNTTSQPQTFQAWSAATGPVGREPALGPKTLTLPPGAVVTRTITQQVPGIAPAGVYTYHVRLGAFPSPVMASASFPITKQAGAAREGANAGGADGWAVSGWDEAASASASSVLPEGFALSEAQPNPSAGRATLTLEVAEAQHVRAEVYDGLGRRVAALYDGVMEAGTAHPLVFEAASLPSGVYVVRLTGETFAAARRLTLLR